MNRQKIRRESAILQRKYEAKYFPRVRAVIKKEVDHVAGIVSREGVQAAMNYVHQHIHSKGIPAIVQALYNEVGSRFARRQWIELQAQKQGRKRPGKSFEDYPVTYKCESLDINGTYTKFSTKGFGFNAQWVQFIKDFLYRFLLEKITFEVARSTRDVLLTTLNRAITEGWGLDKTVAELDELPLSATQAARIVRTEVTRAANTGVMAAGSTYEWQQTKEWIASKDTRTRGNPFNGSNDHASHWALDGQVIDSEDVFTDPRNGDKLRFPGDPNASAASTINCRCNIALVTKIDENGRLIPKKNNFANVTLLT